MTKLLSIARGTHVQSISDPEGCHIPANTKCAAPYFASVTHKRLIGTRIIFPSFYNTLKFQMVPSFHPKFPNNTSLYTLLNGIAYEFEDFYHYTTMLNIFFSFRFYYCTEKKFNHAIQEVFRKEFVRNKFFRND